MSKAGSSLLWATLIRAADHAHKQDPQLARIYYQQMVERGADHLKPLCVVAGHLAERTWAVMRRGMPYVICDTDRTPVTRNEAERIIREQWTVPSEVRRRRRSKKVGKAPHQAPTRQAKPDTQRQSAHEATFPTNDPQPGPPRRQTSSLLTPRSPIGNQPSGCPPRSTPTRSGASTSAACSASTHS